MPVWLSLFLAVLATGGLLGGLVFAVTLLVEGKRLKASPKLGVSPGEIPGTINISADWDPKQFNVQIYRVIFRHASPYSKNKEGIFAHTFENPQTEPFILPVELTTDFKELIEKAPEKFVVTIELKSVEELTLIKNFTAKGIRAIYQGKGAQPKISKKLPVGKPDLATVYTLDFQELTVRRKKLKDLEAAAKAKAAAKAAAPAPKPAAAPAAAAPAPATPPPAAPATPAPAASAAAAKPVTPPPAAAVPTKAPEDQPASAKPATAEPVKSVRDVVAAKNAAKAPADKA